MTPTSRTRPQLSRRHGLTTLKRAIHQLGDRAIDGRTSVGKALQEWRADLIVDLGGPDAISAQQTAILDVAVKTKLLLDSIDGWLLTQPTLINARKRALLPAVLQRQQLADALARYMMQLGLTRRRAVVDLAQAFRQVARDGKIDGEKP
jgi:hypothetical protein